MDKQTKNKADGLTYRDRHKHLSLYVYIFAHFFIFLLTIYSLLTLIMTLCLRFYDFCNSNGFVSCYILDSNIASMLNNPLI